MTTLHFMILMLVAIGGTGVVLTRNPATQAIVASLYGLLLAILFVALQAPDVALSALVVSVIVMPLLTLLALAKVRDYQLEQRSQKQ